MAKCNASPPVNLPTPRRLAAIFKLLAELYPRHPLNVGPADTFRVLVAAVLSSRTKDPTTNMVMDRLWTRASTPEGISSIPETELAALLNPVGFYQTKARHLHGLSRRLLDNHNGLVPRTREELMALPGVGRKVANLVLNICFDVPAICVDTHVHRICNRLGWLATSEPLQTEQALNDTLPVKYWTTINRVLVNHGQQVCHPTSPKCSECRISRYCERCGVTRSR